MLTYFYSRDNGPPYSTWLAYVDKKFDVPVNAILLTFAFTCCMSLINLGSKVAFEAMLSLATVALMATYLMSIGCVLLKRLRGEELPPARWSLGRYGLAVNVVALLYTSWSVSCLVICSPSLAVSLCYHQFFWAFWPTTYHIDSSTFNWACPLFLLFLGCALLAYRLHGKDAYEGPVTLTDTYATEE
jgi:choline transport protein